MPLKIQNRCHQQQQREHKNSEIRVKPNKDKCQNNHELLNNNNTLTKVTQSTSFQNDKEMTTTYY